MKSTLLAAALLLVVCFPAFAGAPAGEPPPPGHPASGLRPVDFTLQSLEGPAVSLGQYLGKKPVLLVFWATWCPECKAAVPEINAVHDGPSGGKIQILALDFRESREQVAAAVKSREIRYPVLLDEGGTVTRDFGVVGIPTYVLIGRDGTIVYQANVLPRDLSRYL
jgi:peroxiredoxin